MSDRLSLSQVAALMAYAATTAGGKTPALRGAGDGPLAERIAGFLLNGYFFVALILYARLTVLWVWIMSFTPLSRAYPFLACIRAHASAWLLVFCRTVVDAVVIIVLICVGFSSLRDERWCRRRREYALSSPPTMRRR